MGGFFSSSRRQIQGVQIAIRTEHVCETLRSSGRRNYRGCRQGLRANKAVANFRCAPVVYLMTIAGASARGIAPLSASMA